jgi:hypothetical protein
MEGFKVLEALISLVLLSIGSLGIVHLHTAVVRGLAASASESLAMDIATQRAESVASEGVTHAPSCLGAVGCATAIGTNAFQEPEMSPDPNAFPCTQWVQAPDVSYMNTPPPADPTARYRVDTVVANHPDANEPGAMLVTVSVCWQDVSGKVQQVQARRVLVPGV